MSLLNIWHLRRVAETSAKPCDICYKPTTSFLITPDSRDFFPVCQTHLKDRGFCSPVIDETEVTAKKKQKEIDRETELIQKEYEEKLKKRKLKEKEKEKGKDEGKEKKTENDKLKEDEEEKLVKEKNDKIKTVAGIDVAPTVMEEIPRIYALNKVFFQKRLDRKRNAEIARRDRERLNTLMNPTLFPSVPTNKLG